MPKAFGSACRCKGRKDPVELDSRKLPGKVTAGRPGGVNPKDYDLVGLAMQEPQYRSPGVRELLDAVAKSRVPCMSIMNMPPLPYVKRIPGLDYDALKPAYTDPSVWDNFDPGLHDAVQPRPAGDPPAGREGQRAAGDAADQFQGGAVRRRQAAPRSCASSRRTIDAVRFDTPEGKIELPVKLKVYDSIFVPLAKWSMLLAGNYRCVTKDGMRTAQEAVHSDIETSRSVYNFVFDLCVKLGANPGDLVPFEKYAAAAQVADAPGLGGARAAERRAQHRARRQARAAHRHAEGHAQPGDRCRRGAGRCAAGDEPQKGGLSHGAVRWATLSVPTAERSRWRGHGEQTRLRCPRITILAVADADR